MVKQQRASSRPPARLKTADSAGSAEQPLPAAQPVAPAPNPRHIEAVALYEEGVAALQSHEFSRASSVLRSVLSRYPEERELHERVRLYLNVCDRHIAPQGATPSTPEERVFAATLAVNVGNLDEALEHLNAACSLAPEHDHALYLLASVLTAREQVNEAIPILLRAIDLNPDNRSRARHDPDFDTLRAFESVRAALDAAGHPKSERAKTPQRRR
jgi:tetratricopeptide (TPR) repeat protein